MIDSFDRDFIKRKIVEKYAINKAAKANELYNKFVSANKETDSTFYCSFKFFKGLSREIVFTYRLINNRAAIVQRLNIIQWRGRYLKSLRENKVLGNATKPVICTDETWIDPFSRSGNMYSFLHLLF